MPTIGGAKVIGLEIESGTIEAGKKDDIIIIDTNTQHMTPIYNPYSEIVYSTNGRDVRDVIINGKIFYRDRRIITLDRDDIMNEIKRLNRRIKNS